MKRSVKHTKADLYRFLANRYKWSFDQIAEMTAYQMAIAVGGIVEGDSDQMMDTFDDYDEALERIMEIKSARSDLEF